MTVDFHHLQQPLPILPPAVPDSVDIVDESAIPAVEVLAAPAPSAAQMPASTPLPTPDSARRSERTNRGAPHLRLAEIMMAAMEESAADDPKTYKQAMKLPDAQEWKDACVAEVASLIENKAYTAVDGPSHKQVVTSKWVFKKKRSMSGAVEKYKARLVARGFTQEEGVDTFATMVRCESVRLMLAEVAAHNLHTA